MHVSSNRPVNEDEEDDVFSLRSLYYGGDVMGCRRPKLKIFNMLESSPQWSLVLFVFQQYFVTKKTEVL